MIERNKSLSVRRQCELLGINRSSLYYTPAKPNLEALRRKEELMRRIDFLHATYPYMGARKVAIMLQREGYSASRKIVRRLMEEMGICAVYPRANLSKRNFKKSIVPYLLRGVTPYFPNKERTTPTARPISSLPRTSPSRHRSMPASTTFSTRHSPMTMITPFTDAPGEPA
jgi:putative transposase